MLTLVLAMSLIGQEEFVDLTPYFVNTTMSMPGSNYVNQPVNVSISEPYLELSETLDFDPTEPITWGGTGGSASITIIVNVALSSFHIQGSLNTVGGNQSITNAWATVMFIVQSPPTYSQQVQLAQVFIGVWPAPGVQSCSYQTRSYGVPPASMVSASMIAAGTHLDGTTFFVPICFDINVIP